MGAPLKNYSKGKIQMTLWENEYQGKKNYSFTIKKRYLDKSNEWKETNFFTEPDLRDLNIILSKICASSIKERAIEKKVEQIEEPVIDETGQITPF